MTVDVRLGLLRDRVIEGGIEFQVLRGRDGWRQIVNPRGGGGRVRYDGWRDVLTIESPQGSLRIQFRWRHTTFSWRGRTYRIVPSLSGMTIFREDDPVVKARLTWSGVRLETVDPEFGGIAQELALGLGYRAMTMAVATAAAV
ncbi:MAG: hypothetical protein ACREDF_11530 [Thermoplasmata archaeon]